MALTEEINGTGSSKSETQRPKTPLWVRQIQESIHGIRKELSALVETKRDDRNTQSMQRKRLFRKYKIQMKKNLDKVIEELKQKNQQRRSNCLDTRKDKTSNIKLKCLEQTARNFTTFSDTHIPM
jgi:type IV secretory pathway VirB10-like protein